MDWKVEYAKTFSRELARLPKDMQDRAEAIVFQEFPAGDPFRLGYIEQLKGHPDKYKIRIGHYRIGITINKKEKRIICQRIAHRSSIYKIFP